MSNKPDYRRGGGGCGGGCGAAHWPARGLDQWPRVQNSGELESTQFLVFYLNHVGLLVEKSKLFS